MINPTAKNTAVKATESTKSMATWRVASPSVPAQMRLTSVGRRAATTKPTRPTAAAAGPTTRARRSVSKLRSRPDSAVTALAAPRPSRARPMTKYV